MKPLRIDSHQHFWTYDPGEYAWIDDRMGAIRRDFTPADLRREMDAAGFDQCVLVQVRQTLDETRDFLALADSHSFIYAVVGWVDLRSETVARDLEAVAAHPKLGGIRHVVQSEPDGFLLQPEFLRGVGELARFDLPYDILIYERQLAEAIDFVSRFPEQRFVLDHLGKPNIRSGDIKDWRWHLRALARFPRVTCKLSGIVTEADWASWTPEQIRPYLETAAECFGPDRLMIGSDWPVCTLAASYGQTMDLVRDLVMDWSADDRDKVLGLNAARVYETRR